MRGITGDLSSADFRFNPKAPDSIRNERGDFVKSVTRPALVVGSTNPQGKIASVQMIYLDPETAQKHPEAQVSKRTIGSTWGNAALIHQGSSNQVILAEGPETGASLINAAKEANIYVSLGNNRNFGNLGYLAKRHETDEVTFAQDNDSHNPKSQSHKGILAATEKLRDEGLTVKGAKPKLLDKEKGTDFNDLLKAKGDKGVKKVLNDAKVLGEPTRQSDLSIPQEPNKQKEALEGPDLSIPIRVPAEEKAAENTLEQKQRSTSVEHDL